MNATGTAFMVPNFLIKGLMPFNVIPLVNTCHALGFSACLMIDALISFRCPLRATEMRLSARVLN